MYPRIYHQVVLLFKDSSHSLSPCRAGLPISRAPKAVEFLSNDLWTWRFTTLAMAITRARYPRLDPPVILRLPSRSAMRSFAASQTGHATKRALSGSQV